MPKKNVTYAEIIDCWNIIKLDYDEKYHDKQINEFPNGETFMILGGLLALDNTKQNVDCARMILYAIGYGGEAYRRVENIIKEKKSIGEIPADIDLLGKEFNDTFREQFNDWADTAAGEANYDDLVSAGEYMLDNAEKTQTSRTANRLIEEALKQEVNKPTNAGLIENVDKFIDAVNVNLDEKEPDIDKLKEQGKEVKEIIGRISLIGDKQPEGSKIQQQYEDRVSKLGELKEKIDLQIEEKTENKVNVEEPAENIVSLDEAIKDFQAAAHAKLRVVSGHAKEFAAISDALSEYTKEGYLDADSAYNIYNACRNYLNTHTEDGKSVAIDGQKTLTGRLRKQAVVQLLEALENSEKDEIELGMNAVENKYGKSRLNKLKESLAANSHAEVEVEVDVNNVASTINKRAYAELKAASKQYQQELENKAKNAKADNKKAQPLRR